MLLRRVYVFFVLEVGARRVHIIGATSIVEWVTQQARNFMTAAGARSERFRFLVRDRDTKVIASFDADVADAGVEVLRGPPRAPKPTRMPRGGEHDPDRMLVFHERQLIQVLSEYERHYNTHRPHRALDQLPPVAADTDRPPRFAAGVRRTQVLGGLINEYEHAA